MDRFEMIERLRERADISYEEARDVLDQAGGDLLEAMVLLEKQGRIRNNGSGADAEGAGASDDSCTAGKKRERSALGKAVHAAWNFLTHTSFHMKHEQKEIFVMPSWAFALLMLFFWHTLVPLMIISLFFNIRYSFDGSEDVAAVNAVLDRAGSFADNVENDVKQEEAQQAEAAEA